MHVIRPGWPPPQAGPGGGPQDAWDIATVVAEFDLAERSQAAAVARLLFAVEEVLTVRVGGPGERTVYRVDVPRDDPEARRLGALPARRAARELGIDVHIVRLTVTRDGLGDPEGEPPPEGAADALRRRAPGRPA